MPVLFFVKVKLIEVKGSKEPKPAINWMAPEASYAVLDVYTWHRTDKDTGVVTVFSKFLIGDPVTGFLHYVDPQGVLYDGSD